MDINFWAIGITIGLLLLALWIFASIRVKSVWSGFVLAAVLSMLVAVLMIVLFGPIILFQYIPEKIQFYIGVLSSLIGCLAFALVSLTLGCRLKAAGNYILKEQMKSAQLAQGAAMFLLFYCQITVAIDSIYSMNAYESYRRNIFGWIVNICLALYSYYSFEYREKGFVHRGKVILFSNIGYARWENPWTKMKLKVRLKDTKQETTLKIPSDMSALVNNYVKANSPRP
ncbi:MAG: hypothetical protein HYZ25_08520 [Chloroflexi bacterium]|nr:hypothetical protein [Chloroflexota bacterium]